MAKPKEKCEAARIFCKACGRDDDGSSRCLWRQLQDGLACAETDGAGDERRPGGVESACPGTRICKCE